MPGVRKPGQGMPGNRPFGRRSALPCGAGPIRLAARHRPLCVSPFVAPVFRAFGCGTPRHLALRGRGARAERGASAEPQVLSRPKCCGNPSHPGLPVPLEAAPPGSASGCRMTGPCRPSLGKNAVHRARRSRTPCPPTRPFQPERHSHPENPCRPGSGYGCRNPRRSEQSELVRVPCPEPRRAADDAVPRRSCPERHFNLALRAAPRMSVRPLPRT